MQQLQRRQCFDQTPLSVKNIYAKAKINFGNLVLESNKEDQHPQLQPSQKNIQNEHSPYIQKYSKKTTSINENYASKQIQKDQMTREGSNTKNIENSNSNNTTNGKNSHGIKGKSRTRNNELAGTNSKNNCVGQAISENYQLQERNNNYSTNFATNPSQFSKVNTQSTNTKQSEIMNGSCYQSMQQSFKSNNTVKSGGGGGGGGQQIHQHSQIQTNTHSKGFAGGAQSQEKYKKGNGGGDCSQSRDKGECQLNVSIRDIKKAGGVFTTNEPISCTNKNAKEGNKKQLLLQTFQSSNIKLSRSHLTTPKYLQFQQNALTAKQGNICQTGGGGAATAVQPYDTGRINNNANSNNIVGNNINYTTRNMQQQANSKIIIGNNNANNTQLYESNLDTSVCKAANLDRSYQQIASTIASNLGGGQVGGVNSTAGIINMSKNGTTLFLNEDSTINKSRIQSQLRPTSSSTFQLENSYLQPPPITEMVTPSSNAHNLNIFSNIQKSILQYSMPITTTNQVITNNCNKKFIFNKKQEGNSNGLDASNMQTSKGIEQQLQHHQQHNPHSQQQQQNQTNINTNSKSSNKIKKPNLMYKTNNLSNRSSRSNSIQKKKSSNLSSTNKRSNIQQQQQQQQLNQQQYQQQQFDQKELKKEEAAVYCNNYNQESNGSLLKNKKSKNSIQSSKKQSISNQYQQALHLTLKTERSSSLKNAGDDYLFQGSTTNLNNLSHIVINQSDKNDTMLSGGGGSSSNGRRENGVCLGDPNYQIYLKVKEQKSSKNKYAMQNFFKKNGMSEQDQRKRNLKNNLNDNFSDYECQQDLGMNGGGDVRQKSSESGGKRKFLIKNVNSFQQYQQKQQQKQQSQQQQQREEEEEKQREMKRVEQMKKEQLLKKEKEEKQILQQCMKEKDQIIENLVQRIQTLEEKFSQIQSQERRDKSQQRINEVIMNLEKRLDQFNKERLENLEKLEMFKSCSSYQQSVSGSTHQLQIASDFCSTQRHQAIEKNKVQQNQKKSQGHFQRSIGKQSELEDLESLVTIMEGEDFFNCKTGSIRTPLIEELEAVNKDTGDEEEDGLKLIECTDVLSDVLPDNSLLMMNDKGEWVDCQKNNNQFELSLNNIQILMDYDNFGVDDGTEEKDYQKNNSNELTDVKKKQTFLKTQKIEQHYKICENDIISNDDGDNTGNGKDEQRRGGSIKFTNGCGNGGEVRGNGVTQNGGGSLSKTFSKNALLNKIRNALGKQSLGSTMKQGLRESSNNNEKKKTPKRFIVKRSNERVKNSTNQKKGVASGLIDQENIINYKEKKQCEEKQQIVLEQMNKIRIQKVNQNSDLSKIDFEKIINQNEENINSLINQNIRVATQQRKLMKKDREKSNQQLRTAIAKLSNKNLM